MIVTRGIGRGDEQVLVAIGLGRDSGSAQFREPGVPGLEYRPSTDRRTIEREDDEMLTVIMAFMRLVR